MRSFRFRPNYDTLDCRITPSDLIPITSGSMVIATPVLPSFGSSSDSPSMPGSGCEAGRSYDWFVSGSPEEASVEVTTSLASTSWLVADPSY